MMAEVVYKYQISLSQSNHIDMPEGANLLTLQLQNNTPTIWCLVDDEKPMVTRIFEIWGTGDYLRPLTHYTRTYIGTFQLHGGALVFHVFEVIEK